jgi:hypothetical protein
MVPAESLTSMLCPSATGSPGGTRNVAMKEPLLSVVIGLGDVDRIVPSHRTVITLDARKPYPVRTTAELTAPVVGALVIEGMILKVADGELTPSVALTVWDPRWPAGTAKVTLKVPVLVVVAFAT